MGVSRVDYGGETLIDLTGDNVSPDTLLFGVRAHNAAGEEIEGTVKANASEVTLSASGWATGSDGRFAQTVSAQGVTADTAIILVKGNFGAIDSDVAQGAGTLTFYATTKPTAAITMQVGIPV